MLNLFIIPFDFISGHGWGLWMCIVCGRFARCRAVGSNGIETYVYRTLYTRSRHIWNDIGCILSCVVFFNPVNFHSIKSGWIYRLSVCTIESFASLDMSSVKICTTFWRAYNCIVWCRVRLCFQSRGSDNIDVCLEHFKTPDEILKYWINKNSTFCRIYYNRHSYFNI